VVSKDRAKKYNIEKKNNTGAVMPEQIFISYRRDDAAYVTGHINDLLRKEFGDESVFTDVDNIALGVDFRAVLDQTVSQCQVLLAVIGSGWLSAADREGKLRLQDPADFVRIEIESALKRNIPVIPLLVSGAKMPAAEDLPESLKGLAFRNGIQIRPAPDFGVDIARLIKNLRTHFDSRRTDEPDSPIPLEPRPAETPVSEPKSAATRAAGREKPDQEDTQGSKFELEEYDRVRKRAELDAARGKKPGRYVAVWMTVLIALGAGVWYYTSQNPETVRSLLGIMGPGTDANPVVDNRADEGPVSPGGRAADVASPAPQERIADEQVTGVAVDAVTGSEATGASDPGAVTGIADEETGTNVDDAVAVAEPAVDAADGASEQAEAAPPGETVADEVAAGPAVEPVDQGAGAAAVTLEADDEITLTPGSQRLSDSSEYISEGVRLAAIDDHEGAISYFDEAIELDVQPAFAYKQRAASYVALGQHDAAVSDYTEAIARNNEDLNAYYNRGGSYMALQDYAAAIADFDVVIQMDPEFVDAYAKRADAHEALGNTEAAVRDRAVVEVFESNRDNPR